MQEKILILVALGTSFLGIGGLFILSFFVKYELVAIQDIDDTFIGKTVRIEGKIISIQKRFDFTTLELQDETGKISVLSYSPEEEYLPQTSIEVLGRVNNYQCSIEVIAEKIHLLPI